MSTPRRPILVIGCGRRHRSDDQVGIRAVEPLAADPPNDVEVLLSEAPAIDLLTECEHRRALLIVDACAATTELPLGAWRRLDLTNQTGPPHTSAGGALRLSPALEAAEAAVHTLGVATALRVADELGLLPPTVWLYTVAGADFAAGEAMSAPVAAAAAALAKQICRDIEALRHTPAA